MIYQRRPQKLIWIMEWVLLLPLCIGLASLSKCFWAHGTAPCGRGPARPCLSCCLLYWIGLTMKPRGFDVRSGRGSESVWQGVWEDVPEGLGGDLESLGGDLGGARESLGGSLGGCPGKGIYEGVQERSRRSKRRSGEVQERV